MHVNIQTIKNNISIPSYYHTVLNGSIGKATGSGWHKIDTLCPFHDDKHAGSFYVNLNTGHYKCFSCGAKGDVIDFHKGFYAMSTKETVQELRRLCS